MQQFFKIENRWVSWEELQKKKKLAIKKITKTDVRNEKIKQLRDKSVEVKINISSEDLDALCKEYKVEVNETTLLNNIK